MPRKKRPKYEDYALPPEVTAPIPEAWRNGRVAGILIAAELADEVNTTSEYRLGDLILMKLNLISKRQLRKKHPRYVEGCPTCKKERRDATSKKV